MQLAPVQESIYCTQENHSIFLVLRNRLENVGFVWRSFYELIFSENCARTIQVVLNVCCSKQPIRSDLQWPKNPLGLVSIRENLHFHLSARIDQEVSLSVWIFFVHPEFNRSQVRPISLWLAVCSKIQEHNIFNQGKLFFFNTNFHSTSTQTSFLQHKYSFSFNSNYFHSTKKYPLNFCI